MTVVLCFAGCILLIPSDVEEFDHVDPQEMASEVLGVKQDEVCVWQQVTKQSMPSQYLLFFMLDLVKELE